MILNIKSPAAPRRRGRRRHLPCGRAIAMAQRHGRPPAGARETLTPSSGTHGLAGPGRGRAEAPRDPPLERRLVATPPRSRGGRPPPLPSQAHDQPGATACQAALLVQSLRHDECQHTVASQALVDERSNVNATLAVGKMQRRVASVQRPPLTKLPSVYGSGSEIVCTACLCLCITCGGWPAAVEVWLL